VDIGIQCKEGISIQQRSENASLCFNYSVDVILEVVPGRSVLHPVPSQDIRTVLRDGLERIDGIAQSLRHLVAVAVEHKTGGDDISKCHAGITRALVYRPDIVAAFTQHDCERMQGEKPSTGLIDTFTNEVCR